MIHLGLLSPTAISFCHDAVISPAFMGLFPLPALGMLWGAGVTKADSKGWHEARRLNCPPIAVGWEETLCFSVQRACALEGDQLGRNTVLLSQATAAVKAQRRWSQNTCRAEVLPDPACRHVLPPPSSSSL